VALPACEQELALKEVEARARPASSLVATCFLGSIQWIRIVLPWASVEWEEQPESLIETGNLMAAVGHDP
jgi:hypothetical protein